ncbi:MAG: hypothetical protein EHM58_08690 [Ignavibacteriae bacterium]|nr:MAG: hypothetical protein EHM58_08690 [Ignavibacteriota bacterium]
MDRYLVESIHTKEEYLKLNRCIDARGYITHCDWGCTSGIHTGWVIIEADSEFEALLSVPPLVRRNARAVRLNKFTPGMIQSFHEKEINT